MKENRNIILLILLLALSALIVLVTLSSGDDRVEVDKNLFRVEDQADVSRVLLESKGQIIDLHFTGNKWMVNEYEADREMIKYLFATLLQAEPKREVSASLRDSVRTKLLTQGVLVKLMKGEEQVKEFRVGGNDRETETYFLQDENAVPYLMTIPGHRVYIASIFEPTLSDWRDKRIFNFNWQNFKSLDVSFPADAKSDFKVSFRNQFFGIENMDLSDTTQLNNYLDAVSLMQGDQFVETGDSKKYDSLAATTPSFTITIHDIATRPYTLEVFPALSDREAVLGRINRKQLILIDPRAIAQIALKKDDFKP